ncbi:MAG: sulfur carrier protein ThiS [Acidobacteria bacterium]|nr:sulfur carrier protein ThiS [Acidobacteriota bacterium]
MSIRLVVNGEDRQVSPSLSVADLLVELDLQIARVAVEHNRRVLKRHEFPRIILADGDRLEIVHFVGGG